MTSDDWLGIVVIGRNEGERLLSCLKSLPFSEATVVYVDSNSTDDSVNLAYRFGVGVVELDPSRKFTAARARNAGFRHLLSKVPGLKYVQFIDGDCELAPEWLPLATSYLDQDPETVAVCGRRRERHPERSVYNQLCDMEWDKAVGPTSSFGGDFLVRANAFEEIGGFRESLIAGEEPELALRLRRQGWQIMVLGAEMTLHDAAMYSFAQWWRRIVRSGYAYAEGMYLHGFSKDRHWVWESLRSWIWAAGSIVLALLLYLQIGPAGLLILLAHPLQVCRQYLRGKGTTRERWLSAVFNHIARFPELTGQLQFMRDLVLKRQSKLIEYK